MDSNTYIIREIEEKDNSKIANTIRKILIEFNVPKVGTAYADVTLDELSEVYKNENAAYFVVEKNNEILGGAGIKQLDNFKGNVCELQKMYFSPEIRGIGLGKKMMDICLTKAKEFGFEKCYLETLPYMVDARKLYKKVGFKVLEKPMGDTGHYSCDIWMIKDL